MPQPTLWLHLAFALLLLLLCTYPLIPFLSSTASTMTLSDLQQPLLVQDDANSSSNAATTKAPAGGVVVVSTLRLQLLAAATGAVIAYISQLLLCLFLWKENVFVLSKTDIVLFSLHWSFWTCLTVFAGMLTLIRLLEKHIQPLPDSTVFQMEAYYVVAALVTITATWLYKDLLEDGQVHQPHPILPLVLPSYMLLAYNLLQAKQPPPANHDESTNTNNLLPTYRLVSAVLGLVVGLSSQFVLSMLLWKDQNMTQPVVPSVVQFSLIWSTLTVVITFAACFSLRILLPDDCGRTVLRMEATYISFSLVGICGAWMIIDWLSGMPDQVVPSLIMLNVSLICFQLILRCFPEDNCLIDGTVEDDDKNNKENKALLVV